MDNDSTTGPVEAVEDKKDEEPSPKIIKRQNNYVEEELNRQSNGALNLQVDTNNPDEVLDASFPDFNKFDETGEDVSQELEAMEALDDDNDG